LQAGQIAKQSEASLAGNYTLQVTLARFGKALEAIEALGRVGERQVKDRQFADSTAPWAAKVQCTITLTLREPARTVPYAGLSVEVTELTEAADTLGVALEKMGGRLLTGKTSKRADGTLQGDYSLQITVARFDEAVAAIESLGRVSDRQIKDRQFADSKAAWAEKVPCTIGLVLYERSRQLPTGNLRLTVDKLDAALEQLDEILPVHGAAITSNQSKRNPDGSSAAELKLRVPAGDFADLVEALPSLGRTTDRQIAGEAGRIVGGAAAMPVELNLTLAEPQREVPSGAMIVQVEKFDPMRQQLSALVAEKDVQVLASGSQQRTDGTWIGGFRLGIKADAMEAVVARLEKLGNVQSRQINGIGLGNLSKIDPNALGVIELTLAEKPAIAPAPERAGNTLRDKLRDGLAGLYSSLGLIAYGLIVLLPWLLIVIVPAWVLARVWRRRSLNRRAVATPTP